MSGLLITGASGLIGHGLSLFFLKKKMKVYGTSFKNKFTKEQKKLVKLKKIDFKNKSSLNKIKKHLHKIDYVIHSAALIPSKSNNKKNQFFKTNYLGTKHIIDLCIEYKIKKFVFISTMGFYNKTLLKKDPYLLSKKKAENYCYKIFKKKKMNISVLRVKAPYGFLVGKSVVQLFINRAINGKNLNLYSKGERKQIFTFVEDIAVASEKLFKIKRFLVEIVGPQIISMRFLAKSVLQVFRKNKKQKIIFLNQTEKNINQNFKFEKKNKMNFKKNNLYQGLIKIKKFLNR